MKKNNAAITKWARMFGHTIQALTFSFENNLGPILQHINKNEQNAFRD